MSAIGSVGSVSTTITGMQQAAAASAQQQIAAATTPALHKHHRHAGAPAQANGGPNALQSGAGPAAQTSAINILT